MGVTAALLASRRRRCAAAAAVLVLGAGWLVLRRPGWGSEVLPSHLPSVPAEVLFRDIGPIVRVGPKRLIVVRFLGPVDFVPVTYQDMGFAAPAPIGLWAKYLTAPVVFNAGQFDANRRYLGWLKGRGKWLSQARKQGWQGLLVTTPIEPPFSSPVSPYGRIVDLQTLDDKAAKQIAASYANVVQSMMLVDDDAQVRVRRTQIAACRTVMAEDDRGRLLLLATEGAVTLYDLAQWLGRSDLHILRAMNLDGGVESQLAIRTEDLSLTLYGQYGTEARMLGPRTGGAQAPLPMVVAAFPRTQPGR